MRALLKIAGKCDRSARRLFNQPQPFCLRGDDVEWEAALDGYDPSVECRCQSCENSWRVYLAPFQALRLGLMYARVS